MPLSTIARSSFVTSFTPQLEEPDPMLPAYDEYNRDLSQVMIGNASQVIIGENMDDSKPVCYKFANTIKKLKRQSADRNAAGKPMNDRKISIES